MKKKILTIVLTALLFFSAAIVGVSTVFRVDSVTLKGEVVSAEGKADAELLKTDLLKAYKRENIFSVNQDEAEKLMQHYPSLRITKFKKEYPDKLVVEVEETVGVFWVESLSGEKFILDKKGIVLTVYPNEAIVEKAENLVQINGFSLTGKKGETLTGDARWQSVTLLCEEIDEELNGITRNVASVEILGGTPSTKLYYLISMREGVKIYMENPLSLAEEKTQKAIAQYLSLTDEERTVGCILVFEQSDLEEETLIVCGYNRNWEFNS